MDTPAAPLQPPTPVQNALTAIFPIKAQYVDALRTQLQQPIDPSGLDAVGTVHFARIFVFAPNNNSGVPSNLAAVITSYDHAFGPYIQTKSNSFPDIFKRLGLGLALAHATRN